MRNLGRLVVAGLFALAVFSLAPAAGAVPEGFQREYLYGPGTGTNNLVYPTNLEFAPDGRMFITEQRGVIKTAASPGSPMSIVADMRGVTHNFWDRGMLGLAVHPDYPDEPFIYVLYTHGVPLAIPLAIPGGPTQVWESGPGVDGDQCPDPPGSTADGCVVSAQLARLTVDVANLPVGPEDIEILIHDWCQQFPSHSIGDLVFGADGALYVSGGDGASFGPPDYGQSGGMRPGTPTPRNPCGDPPGGAGGVMVPETAEGGALRAQDLLTAHPDDPVSADGAILRINPLADPSDPDTLLLPDNPSDSDDPIGSLIVAHGLRNPYRMTVRPGTNEIYIADVGYNTWEEINRILDPTARVLNFGWPCYEGPVPQDGYAWFGMCQDLISGDYGPVTAPFFAYRHNRDIQHPEDDDCPPAETGQMSRTSSSTTGLAFYTGSSYPSQYDGALFGADYSRGCIWVMRAGADGRPNPSTVSVFHFEPTVQGAEGITPVDLETGPDGRIYGVSIMKGHIFRFNWTGANDAPTAVIDAEESEDNELEWILDGTRSIDPENKELTYAWDLDNDGLFDDETDGVVSRQFTPGPHRIGLRVTDIDGASSSTSIVIQVANTVPQATIHTPSSSFRWAVGETISYSGSGFDDEDGTIPGSQMHWAVILHHCGDDGSCHEHHVRSTVGESGSLSAPEHEYPSWLELRLTVEDSWGPDSSSTASVRLDPKTVQISVKSEPEGINVGAGTTPFSDTVIVGSRISLAAPTTVERCGRTLQFSHWSNGGTRIQEIPAPATPTTYTAVYNPSTACDGIGLVDVTTGEWHLRDPRTQLTTSFYFGNPGDYPFMGDWDCDGVATPGLYRQSDGFVYLRNSNTQGVADITFFFGNPGDVPIAGDFNGDGCDTVSIYRPSEQRFYIINKLGKNGGGLGAAEFSYIFGNPGDKPFVGDFDGDGKDTIGLHRESTGLVYFRNTHTQGVADAQFIFGDPGDRLVAGRWAAAGGPGRDTVGVFRPSNGMMYLKFSNTQGVADESFEYGSASMWPVAGNFGNLPGGSPPPG